ncbi:lysophospholipid acyltransferase family protein [Desulfobacula sp.]
MKFQSVLNSKIGVGLGFTILRSTPTSISYPLVIFFAKQLARMKNLSLVQSVQRNQQVIHNGRLSSKELQKAVTNVFVYAGRCFIDFYRALKNPDALQEKVLKNEAFERLIRLSRDKNFGAFLVVPHMSSFDLMLLAAADLGFEAKVLTFGNPTGGYKLQNDIRAISGLEIMPVSREVLTKSIDVLRKGGFVLTAIDRPISHQRRQLNFFGQPSPLPAGHIRMAIKADVPVLVAAVHMNPDGFYQLSLSDPISMVHMLDPVEKIRHNAEKILQIIEGYIRSHPSQWQMYYPVWPNQKATFTD